MQGGRMKYVVNLHTVLDLLQLKVKTFVDKNLNGHVVHTMELVFDQVENIVGNGKSWVFPFPTMFSKCIFL